MLFEIHLLQLKSHSNLAFCGGAFKLIQCCQFKNIVAYIWFPSIYIFLLMSYHIINCSKHSRKIFLINLNTCLFIIMCTSNTNSTPVILKQYHSVSINFVFSNWNIAKPLFYLCPMKLELE